MIKNGLNFTTISNINFFCSQTLINEASVRYRNCVNRPYPMQFISVNLYWYQACKPNSLLIKSSNKNNKSSSLFYSFSNLNYFCKRNPNKKLIEILDFTALLPTVKIKLLSQNNTSKISHFFAFIYTSCTIITRKSVCIIKQIWWEMMNKMVCCSKKPRYITVNLKVGK